jgi:hypothetical protein
MCFEGAAAVTVNSKGDDRQAWLLMGMALRMSEDSELWVFRCTSLTVKPGI